MGPHPLLDVRMHDGSRRFAAFPERYDARAPEWHRLRARVEQLPGARLDDFVTDDVTEAWIDFAYRGQRFAVNNQCGEWWFFVQAPSCPDDILHEVIAHFASVLPPARGS